MEKYDEEDLKFVNCKGQIWAVCLENVRGARQGAKIEWPGTSYRRFVCLWKLDKVVGFSIFLKLFWSRKHVPVSQHSFLYHGVLNNKFNGENTRPALFVNMISKLGTRYFIYTFLSFPYRGTCMLYNYDMTSIIHDSYILIKNKPVKFSFSKIEHN